jgi:small subunit ribosomal protein S4
MARYTGADCRRCRREKMKLFLKGSKCESPKCPIEIRPYPPGEHGRGRTKDSEYLLQKREKQKCARIYGVLEKQFRGYYEEANKKSGKTGENLLVILESRLDNVVYRAGFAPPATTPARPSATGTSWSTARRSTSRATASRPTTSSRSGPKSRELTPYVIARETAGERTVPAWLEVISSQMRVLVHALPPVRSSTRPCRSS